LTLFWRASVLLSLLALVPGFGLALDHAPQSIEGQQVWLAADSPHVVRGTITIEEGAGLTIEAGATLQFARDFESGIVVHGRLVAAGLPSQPIVFQGLDSSVTLEDVTIDGAIAGVAISAGTLSATASHFTHSVRLISAWGGNTRITVGRATFESNHFGLDTWLGAQVIVSDSTFTGNRTAAYSDAGSLQLTSNEFDNNQHNLVAAQPDRVIESGSRIGGNAASLLPKTRALAIAGGLSVSLDITSNTMWTPAQNPILVTGQITSTAA
jgi:hypothetical protein